MESTEKKKRDASPVRYVVSVSSAEVEQCQTEIKALEELIRRNHSLMEDLHSTCFQMVGISSFLDNSNMPIRLHWLPVEWTKRKEIGPPWDTRLEMSRLEDLLPKACLGRILHIRTHQLWVNELVRSIMGKYSKFYADINPGCYYQFYPMNANVGFPFRYEDGMVFRHHKPTPFQNDELQDILSVVCESLGFVARLVGKETVTWGFPKATLERTKGSNIPAGTWDLRNRLSMSPEGALWLPGSFTSPDPANGKVTDGAFKLPLTLHDDCRKEDSREIKDWPVIGIIG